MRFLLHRREWCYAQSPQVYAIAPCSCGNAETQWSEWTGRLWCDKCGRDFVPAHNGVFDGAIPLHAANLLGIRFDRIDLLTMKVVRQKEYLA
jgi:hypothetical protein